MSQFLNSCHRRAVGCGPYNLLPTNTVSRRGFLPNSPGPGYTDPHRRLSWWGRQSPGAGTMRGLLTAVPAPSHQGMEVMLPSGHSPSTITPWWWFLLLHEHSLARRTGHLLPCSWGCTGMTLPRAWRWVCLSGTDGPESLTLLMGSTPDEGVDPWGKHSTGRGFHHCQHGHPCFGSGFCSCSII